jgi:hypothetical protein
MTSMNDETIQDAAIVGVVMRSGRFSISGRDLMFLLKSWKGMISGEKGCPEPGSDTLCTHVVQRKHSTF